MVENWSVRGPLRPEAVPRRPVSKRENPTGSWAKKSYEAIVLFISLLILCLLFPQFLGFCKLFVIGESWNFSRRRERGTREQWHQSEKRKGGRKYLGFVGMHFLPSFKMFHCCPISFSLFLENFWDLPCFRRGQEQVWVGLNPVGCWRWEFRGEGRWTWVGGKRSLWKNPLLSFKTCWENSSGVTQNQEQPERVDHGREETPS